MYIASIAADIKIHAWPSGQLVNTYKATGNGGIRTISWGKDGNWLVLVPMQGPAEIIAVRENVLKHLYTIEDIQHPTCAVFQNLTKRNVALGTNTGNILVYDIKSKSVRKHFPRAPSTVFRAEYGMKDTYLLAACENGEILKFNSSTLNCSACYKVPDSKSVSSIRTHFYRRNLFMAGSEEGIVAVWDIFSNSVVHKNPTHQAIVTDVSFSPIRHDLIVSCGLDRKFVFWDTTSNSVVLEKLMDRSPTAIDFCPDGVGLAVGTQSGSIYTYDTRRMNAPMYVFNAHQSFVKQLLFQRKCPENSGDYGLMLSNQESGDGAVPRIEPSMLPAFDSFGSLLCEVSCPNGEQELIQMNRERDSNSDIQQDSFLDAIGLTSNSFKDSHCGPISKGVRNLLDSKPNLLDSGASDHSPNHFRDFDRSKQSKDVELRRVKNNLRDTPKDKFNYQEFDYGSSPTHETGDNIWKDVPTRGSRRPSHDQAYPQRRKSDHGEEQTQRLQRSEGTHEASAQEHKIQGDHHRQQAAALSALKHRQVERVAPPAEIKYQPTNEQPKPANVPIEALKTSQSQYSSTPKTQAQTSKTPVLTYISPIVGSVSSKPTMMEVTDFHNTIRQVVKQEVKDQLDTFHQSLKYDIMEVLAQIRRNFLDMQMSIVKEFVQLESIVNKVREDLINEEGVTDELLVQENIRLRKEIAALREQINNNKE